MRPKSVVLAVACMLATLSGAAKSVSQKVERIGGNLYLCENQERFKVDTKVITVKLRQPESELGDDFKVIHSNRLGYVDIQVPDGTDVEKYVSSLNSTGRFETVEFNGEAKCCFAPNDLYFSFQWYVTAINLDKAWEFTKGNQDIKVAIIDNGVDASHPDLGYTAYDGYSQIDTINGVNYTSQPNCHLSPLHEHGTMVAGIIGAKTNNYDCIAGVCGGNHSKGITIIPYCVGVYTEFTNCFVDDAILRSVGFAIRPHRI